MSQTSHKQRLWDFWQQLAAASADSAADVARTYLHDSLDFNASHPINQQRGVEQFLRGFWMPLKRAVPDVRHSPHILMAGTFREQAWVCATGHLHGTFAEDWLGIPATGAPLHIRSGEFWRVEDGRFAECYLLLDLVDVMRQAGYRVLPERRGRSGAFPPPQTGDGVRLTGEADEEETRRSLALVEAMINEGLMAYDGKTLTSMHMDRYWYPDMRWYGPEGIGTAHSLREFEDFHQRHFLGAFPDRRGGNHKSRIAEGVYVASTGWPSIRATHAGEYLGTPATGQQITMRVMDWWRRDGDLLAENWVFIDLIDLFLQFGVDLFARLAQQIAGRRA